MFIFIKPGKCVFFLLFKLRKNRVLLSESLLFSALLLEANERPESTATLEAGQKARKEADVTSTDIQQAHNKEQVHD